MSPKSVALEISKSEEDFAYMFGLNDGDRYLQIKLKAFYFNSDNLASALEEVARNIREVYS